MDFFMVGFPLLTEQTGYGCDLAGKRAWGNVLCTGLASGWTLRRMMRILGPF
jgi:hypothetical protein